MLDEILSTLKSQAAPELMNTIGLNAQQTDGSITAAADSVKQVIGGGDGFGLDDMLNLFSSAQNNSNADGILSNISQVFNGKLTSDVGLSAQQAGGVKDLLLPMIMNLISGKVGGNANNLQGLLSAFTGQGGGLAEMAGGLLKGLFK
ncbi:MAG: hypothetical protein JST41_04125 [Bacteroidetes bacterium]|nr:hypothetical protein [Bacteroidota bacterium]MBX7129239.1 hypothetical protein [Flavobacteriales bacterium]MCC6653830.1 hypothetical protein [Flavobacteriales bacterium]HMU14862.1 hypothetical protein [Flavobacteriales bacterium]HMW96765.1 hypothetical protein [Flavobacteriales bacterium]